ncbi:MAG: DNA mismatch repair protein MutL, partial [Hungatella sp.]
IEEAYKPFLMQHKYPFALLHLSIEPEYLDVNVHPTKMELRFRNEEQIYELLYQAIHDVLAHQELIPEVNLERRESGKIMTPETTVKAPRPEPFETKRFIAAPVTEHKLPVTKPIYEAEPSAESVQETPTAYLPAKQLDLFEEKLLEPKNRLQHKLIGQIFDTYWLVEFHEQLYIIDQHAAHEKVLYERTIRSLKERDYTSQMVNPPIILTLSSKEEVLLKKHLDYFTEMGFEIEPFGGKEYAVRAVPDNLFRIAKKELLMEMIDGLSDEISSQSPDVIYERVASMSCKAAVKGNHALSVSEANELIDQLLELDNPYACPHGRPTIISMSKYELEKKFKRIL